MRGPQDRPEPRGARSVICGASIVNDGMSESHVLEVAPLGNLSRHLSEAMFSRDVNAPLEMCRYVGTRGDATRQAGSVSPVKRTFVS